MKEVDRPPHSAWFVLVVAAIVAAIASVLIWWLLRPEVAPDPLPTPTSTVSPTPSPSVSPTDEPIILEDQYSLLIQLRNEDRVALGNALSVGGGDELASIMTIPSNLLVDVRVDGVITLGESADLDDTLGSVRAVEDTLGVRVNAGLMLDRLAVAALVDSIGGVVVTLTEPLVILDEQGSVVERIPAGAQLLDGVQAAEFVLQPGLSEPDRMTRVTALLDQILVRLPKEPERIRQLLISLGAQARSTVSTDELVAIVEVLHEAAVAQRLGNTTLPVRDVRGGKAVVLDQPAADQELWQTMPELYFQTGDATRPRVLVRNGSGSATPMATARQELTDSGFAFVSGGVQATALLSTVSVVSSTEADLQKGADVAAALGLPASAVTIERPTGERVDVVVVLGADYPAQS